MHFPIIPSEKEIEQRCEIHLWWKNVEDDVLMPIEIEIYCWSSNGVRYITNYRLSAVNLNSKKPTHFGGEAAPGVSLGMRRTTIDVVWKLEFYSYLGRIRPWYMVVNKTIVLWAKKIINFTKNHLNNMFK